jgi:carboxypeptidase family protein/TonB-dependent receptor-like protein
MPQRARTEDVVHSPYIPATRAPADRASRVIAPGIGGATRRVGFLLAILALPGVAAAQQRTGAVSGAVKDSAGSPIFNVEVVALRGGRSIRTDSSGHFVLGGLPSGATDLGIRRIAYEPVVVSVDIPDSDTTEIEIRLGGLARSLPTVVVTERAEHVRMLVEFESRRKNGAGHFITRSQIEKRHPLLLSDMVRSIPGATIVPAENGRPVLRFARSHNSCPPQYFLDGLRVTSFNIDDVPPGDVEGVELYAGAAGLPPEFNQLYGNTICGTVAIWTRIPGNAPAKP